jgi:hypothetical protein
MGKSECKRLLFELAPWCFTPAESETAGVILEDSCVRLQKLMSALMHDDGKSYTLDELAIRFFTPVVRALQKPSATKVYVALFDKSTFVTSAKQPEQRSRDGGRKNVAQKRKNMKDVPRSNLDLTPRNAGSFCMQARQVASDFVHDRQFKYFFTKLISQRGAELLPEMMRKGGVSSDCCIVIDAERLFADDGQSLSICRSVETDDEMLRSELSNRIGEFDVAQTHYLRSPSLQKLAGGFLVDTIDTDLLFVNILHSGIDGYPPRVRVRCTLPPSKEHFDFDPSQCNLWIQSILGPSGADQLVKAYTLSGSDFCHGVPGQGNARFLSDFLSLRGTVTPADHFKSACGLFMSKGTRRASSTKASGDAQRQARSVIAQCERADYVLDYWTYTGYKDELVPSPLGRGFALRSGFVEYAEDIDCCNE